MTKKLRSFLLAGAASLGLGAFAIGPAHAVLATVDTADFVFEESVSGGVGTFTIINKPGSGWYIWGFAVTNIVGSDPATTYSDWNASTCDNNCAYAGYMGSGFSYQSTAGDTDPVMYDIGPGESSSLFTFIDPMGGTPLFYITNSDGAFEYITPTGTATPEPSTWAMLIAGFGFLGWRYARRGGMRKLVGAA